MLAVWAHRGSSEEGRISWLRENAPSSGAWSAVLLAKGFRSIEDPAWKEKAYVEMPEASRKKDTALISEDLRTVAVRSGSEWLFYDLGRSAGAKPPGMVVKRELWSGLGIGWEALAAIDHTEFPIARTAEVKPAPEKVEWSDPRSMSY